MKKRKKAKLGKEYRDIVSGFVGIATAEYRFLNDCVRVQLTGKSEEGKKPQELVFDIEQIEKIGDGVKTKSKPTGGGAIDDIAPRTGLE